MEKNYKIEAETGKYSLSLRSSSESYIKRGKDSVILFTVVYEVILTLAIGTIQLCELTSWYHRIIAMTLLAILFFYLCFFSNTFRNKTIWMFSKIEEHKEKNN
jgi:hypothetical protein